SDHKVIDGLWKGATWSFDAANSILTIDGIELYLARECDWESADRHATIVFAGIKGTTTYWGKKS
ncbi:MAG: arabinan endo-1,5-alpha-L-arabinosidase, partial [Muribaculaceae bacterium]|nr:arabinan endo-1,5-alpha-L-arabinosidase [Muribaculaceae bacterium]